MLRIYVLLVTAVCVYGDVIDGTTLLQTFLIHRHGDRTPVQVNVAMTTDIDAVEAAIEPYGYGQLTNVGKRRSYELGKFIRERYSSLLSASYNSSEIYIRSTDSTRSKMTVLAAMAAVYPPYPGSWSEEINWVPIPYTTVPAKYDFNLALINCPNFMAAYRQSLFSSPASLDQYADVMAVITKSSDIMVGNIAALPYGYYDAFTSQISLGVPLSEDIAAIMPRLEEAAGEAMDIILGNEDSVHLLAGVLLNEFFTHAASLISEQDTPRVRVYSAHDINVFALMAVAKVPHQGVPKYSSAFALELRKVIATGKYVVLAVYKPDPNEELVYLHIADCDLLCDLEQFHELVSENLLDEDTWRTKCDFTEDLVIDDSSIN